MERRKKVETYDSQAPPQGASYQPLAMPTSHFPASQPVGGPPTMPGAFPPGQRSQAHSTQPAAYPFHTSPLQPVAQAHAAPQQQPAAAWPPTAPQSRISAQQPAATAQGIPSLGVASPSAGPQVTSPSQRTGFAPSPVGRRSTDGQQQQGFQAQQAPSALPKPSAPPTFDSGIAAPTAGATRYPSALPTAPGRVSAVAVAAGGSPQKPQARATEPHQGLNAPGRYISSMASVAQQPGEESASPKSRHVSALSNSSFTGTASPLSSPGIQNPENRISQPATGTAYPLRPISIPSPKPTSTSAAAALEQARTYLQQRRATEGNTRLSSSAAPLIVGITSPSGSRPPLSGFAAVSKPPVVGGQQQQQLGAAAAAAEVSSDRVFSPASSASSRRYSTPSPRGPPLAPATAYYQPPSPAGGPVQSPTQHYQPQQQVLHQVVEAPPQLPPVTVPASKGMFKSPSQEILSALVAANSTAVQPQHHQQELAVEDSFETVPVERAVTQVGEKQPAVTSFQVAANPLFTDAGAEGVMFENLSLEDKNSEYSQPAEQAGVEQAPMSAPWDAPNSPYQQQPQSPWHPGPSVTSPSAAYQNMQPQLESFPSGTYNEVSQTIFDGAAVVGVASQPSEQFNVSPEPVKFFGDDQQGGFESEFDALDQQKSPVALQGINKWTESAASRALPAAPDMQNGGGDGNGFDISPAPFPAFQAEANGVDEFAAALGGQQNYDINNNQYQYDQQEQEQGHGFGVEYQEYQGPTAEPAADEWETAMGGASQFQHIAAETKAAPVEETSFSNFTVRDTSDLFGESSPDVPGFAAVADSFEDMAPASTMAAYDFGVTGAPGTGPDSSFTNHNVGDQGSESFTQQQQQEEAGGQGAQSAAAEQQQQTKAEGGTAWLGEDGYHYMDAEDGWRYYWDEASNQWQPYMQIPQQSHQPEATEESAAGAPSAERSEATTEPAAAVPQDGGAAFGTESEVSMKTTPEFTPVPMYGQQPQIQWQQQSDAPVVEAVHTHTPSFEESVTDASVSVAGGGVNDILDSFSVDQNESYQTPGNGGIGGEAQYGSGYNAWGGSAATVPTVVDQSSTPWQQQHPAASGAVSAIAPPTGPAVFQTHSQTFQPSAPTENLSQMPSQPQMWTPPTAAASSGGTFGWQPAAQQPAAQQYGMHNQQQRGFMDGYQSGMHQQQQGGYSPHGRPGSAFATLHFGGRMVYVSPTGQLSIHSITKLPPTINISVGAPVARMQDVQEMLGSFPGPLSQQVNKDKLLEFIGHRMECCVSEESGVDAVQLRTLWNVLRIMVQHQDKLGGSVAAEGQVGDQGLGAALAGGLMEGSHHHQHQQQQHPAMLVGAMGPADYNQGSAAAAHVQSLLLAGRKSEALSAAVQAQLWPIAFVIARLVGPQAFSDTVAQFSNSALAPSPLRTLCLATSGTADKAASAAAHTHGNGTTPPASTAVSPMAGNAGAARSGVDTHLSFDGEALARWQEHLAVMVANHTPGNDKAIEALGTQLYASGHLAAAHTCFALAGMALQYGDGIEGGQFAIVGRYPVGQQLQGFLPVAAILRTEIYSWSQTNGKQNQAQRFMAILPYKLLHALYLTDLGMLSSASQYCASINQSIQGMGAKVPPGLLVCRAVALELSDRLQQHAMAHKISLSQGFNTGALVSSMGKLLDRGISALMGGADGRSSSRNHSRSNSIVTDMHAGPHGHVSGGEHHASPAMTRASSQHHLASGEGGQSQGDGQPKLLSSFMKSIKNVVAPPSTTNSARSGSAGGQGPDGDPENVFYYDTELKMWRERGVDHIPQQQVVGPPPTTSTWQQHSPMKSTDPSSGGGQIPRASVGRYVNSFNPGPGSVGGGGAQVPPSAPPHFSVPPPTGATGSAFLPGRPSIVSPAAGASFMPHQGSSAPPAGVTPPGVVHPPMFIPPAAAMQHHQQPQQQPVAVQQHQGMEYQSHQPQHQQHFGGGVAGGQSASIGVTYLQAAFCADGMTDVAL